MWQQKNWLWLGICENLNSYIFRSTEPKLMALLDTFDNAIHITDCQHDSCECCKKKKAPLVAKSSQGGN